MSRPSLYLTTDRSKSAPLRELDGRLNPSSEPPKENTVATELHMFAQEEGDGTLILHLTPDQEYRVTLSAVQPSTSYGTVLMCGFVVI